MPVRLKLKLHFETMDLSHLASPITVGITNAGTGIDEQDHASIGLAHHTSKICLFEDLEKVDSFGFRGQAINSLCVTAQVEITTCSVPPLGKQLTFDRYGALLNSKATARSKGTTVTVSKLFYTLPVRKAEFKRNLKAQFNKAVAMIHAFVLGHTSVRFTVTNTTAGEYVVLM